MAEYTEQELKKSIEQGNFSNVYFFYGEEKMLMESAVKKLVHQATGNQFLDFNYQILMALLQMRKKLCVLRKGCRLWQIINASL